MRAKDCLRNEAGKIEIGIDQRHMTDENSFLMVNFSVWQNVSLERAKSTVPNVAYAYSLPARVEWRRV
jgi:hypothetical protein